MSRRVRSRLEAENEFQMSSSARGGRGAGGTGGGVTWHRVNTAALDAEFEVTSRQLHPVISSAVGNKEKERKPEFVFDLLVIFTLFQLGFADGKFCSFRLVNRAYEVYPFLFL